MGLTEYLVKKWNFQRVTKLTQRAAQWVGVMSQYAYHLFRSPPAPPSFVSGLRSSFSMQLCTWTFSNTLSEYVVEHVPRPTRRRAHWVGIVTRTINMHMYDLIFPSASCAASQVQQKQRPRLPGLSCDVCLLRRCTCGSSAATLAWTRTKPSTSSWRRRRRDRCLR